MSHAKGLLTPARALHRVLLLEYANATSKISSSSFSSSALPSSPILRTRAWTAPTATHPEAKCRRTRRPFSTTPTPAFAAQKTHLRDDEIPYRWVRIADSTGTLSKPQRTANVLADLPEGFSLVMVAPPPPQKPTPTTTTGAVVLLQPSAAICRVVDAHAEREAEVAAELEARAAAQSTKELELNWAIAAHDLAHKTKRLVEFLDKGLRVEVMLARKKGSRKSVAEEETALVERVREVVAGVPGTKEYRKMEGEVGKVVRMFFEGPAGKAKVKGKGKGKKGGGSERGDEEV
ncbi:hypothetical protein F5Y12DRAFT_35232 [Xylaria sp. FL1777]|nr:hypothetical protein F5Y12DRAFT_35232 [Xylaria sp. FL1777]